MSSSRRSLEPIVRGTPSYLTTELIPRNREAKNDRSAEDLLAQVTWSIRSSAILAQ